MLLIEAVKGGRTGLKTEKPLFIMKMAVIRMNARRFIHANREPVVSAVIRI
jgi:hypothetical protein